MEFKLQDRFIIFELTKSQGELDPIERFSKEYEKEAYLKEINASARVTGLQADNSQELTITCDNENFEKYKKTFKEFLFKYLCHYRFISVKTNSGLNLY